MDKLFFVTEPKVGMSSVHFAKEGSSICACGCGIKGDWVVDRKDVLDVRRVLNYASGNTRAVCDQCLTNVMEAAKRGVLR